MMGCRFPAVARTRFGRVGSSQDSMRCIVCDHGLLDPLPSNLRSKCWTERACPVHSRLRCSQTSMRGSRTGPIGESAIHGASVDCHSPSLKGIVDTFESLHRFRRLNTRGTRRWSCDLEYSSLGLVASTPSISGKEHYLGFDLTLSGFSVSRLFTQEFQKHIRPSLSFTAIRRCEQRRATSGRSDSNAFSRAAVVQPLENVAVDEERSALRWPKDFRGSCSRGVIFMKAFLIVAGSVFALAVFAYIARITVEPRMAREPWFWLITLLPRP